MPRNNFRIQRRQIQQNQNNNNDAMRNAITAAVNHNDQLHRDLEDDLQRTIRKLQMSRTSFRRWKETWKELQRRTKLQRNTLIRLLETHGVDVPANLRHNSQALQVFRSIRLRGNDNNDGEVNGAAATGAEGNGNENGVAAVNDDNDD